MKTYDGCILYIVHQYTIVRSEKSVCLIFSFLLKILKKNLWTVLSMSKCPVYSRVCSANGAWIVSIFLNSIMFTQTFYTDILLIYWCIPTKLKWWLLFRNIADIYHSQMWYNSVNGIHDFTFQSWFVIATVMFLRDSWQKLIKFFSFWYMRYLLVTELYIVEPWERAVMRILLWFLSSKWLPVSSNCTL